MKKTKGLLMLGQKAESGNEKAIEKLGEKYAELRRKFLGKGDIPEWIVEGLEKAVKLFDDYGIDTEGKDAVFQLAQDYMDKNDTTKHKKVCDLYIEFLGLYSNDANWIALNNLACRFENGEGIEKDVELSLGIYKLLTHIGYSYGRLNLAECYEEGKGTQKDLEKAIDLYEQLVKDGIRDGSKELARERLEKHGYSEHSLDELENDYQIECVAEYMKGNFVCIELGGHIRIWSADVQDILPTAQLQDEGLITDEIKELFKTLKQGGTLIDGRRSKNYPLETIKEKDIKAIQRFRPEFSAWADAWEKVIRILEEQKTENAEEKEYYFIVKKPSIAAEQKITEVK